MEKANSGMLMVIFMKANEKMIKQMDKEFIITVMVLNTKEAGRTICKMALELKHGMMTPSMRDNFLLEKRKDKELIFGLMAPNTKELEKTIKLVDMCTNTFLSLFF